ncbi:MAG: RDD family protein [Chlorobi bacterium]|nr:RDD family protein [Chlorobiota bacterium]
MDTPIVTYAGFWKRFVAVFIDGIVISIVQTLLFFPLYLFFGISLFPFMNADKLENEFSTIRAVQYANDDVSLGFFVAIMSGIAFLVVVTIVLQWLYFALMESSSKQATLGKMALGIKVTDLDGNRISFGRATGRYFGKIISGMIFYIGFMMAGWTQKKQALHDMLAGCLVVNN